MPVLRELAGSRCLLPHPPAAPDGPIPALPVGGIPPGIAVAGSRRFTCVRVLFALPGWTCLYLLSELGDTCCQESQTAVPAPCLRLSEGLTSPTFGQDPTSLQTLLGPAVRTPQCQGAQTPPQLPVAGHGLRQFWGGHHGLPSRSYKTLGVQIPLMLGWRFLSLPGGTWGC